MVVDAFRDRWEVAFLVSGDADLVPPIKAILAEFPQKRVFVIHPPCRTSTELKQAASLQTVFHINEVALKKCQLDDGNRNRHIHLQAA